MAIHGLDCHTSLRYVRNDGSIVFVCYTVLHNRCHLVGFLVSGESVGIVGSGERICRSFVYGDDSGDIVSDDSLVGVDFRGTVDGSLGDFSFGERIDSGFNLKHIETFFYVFESSDSIGVSSGTLEGSVLSEGDSTEDDEDGDDDDEFDEGETAIFRPSRGLPFGEYFK